MKVLKEKKVLVAAMDWGIGHASRCVPIIRQLQENGYNVILASSGRAKDFFQDYFPELIVLDKPAYNVSYPEKSSMVFAIIKQLPSLTYTVIREHRWLKKIIRDYNISEVVSDNCYGLWNKKIHSVFITHQLMVKCPKRLKFLENTIHRSILYFVKKYNECYIPDINGHQNYTGALSHSYPLPPNAKFIGTLSRFCYNKSEEEAESFDLVVLLSGPEPQRTILEKKCIRLLRGTNKRCCLIRGLPGEKNQLERREGFVFYNHIPDDTFKAILKKAKKVICRSGYSTIMDLLELNVKAMLVPTPGQTEQEYLARHNHSKDQFEMIEQDQLNTAELLREVKRPAIHFMYRIIECLIESRE